MRCLLGHTKLIVTNLLIASLLGCGGGGSGSDDPTEPASVAVGVNPQRFDTGDQTNVTVYLQDVHPDGIMVKIRSPKVIEYLDNSGFFTVDGTTYKLLPDIYKSDETFNYMVYFFKQNDFGKNGQGEIRLRYEANGPVGSSTDTPSGSTGATGSSGTTSIDVDVDINDLDVPDSTEFDVADPKFTAEDSKTITVS